MMKFSDNFTASGGVKIYAIRENTAPELLWSDCNTLTLGLHTTIAKLLAGEVGTMIGTQLRTVQTGTAKWASFMKIGTGTTLPDVNDLDVETAIQETLIATDLALPVSSVSFSTPLPGSVTFISTLGGGTDSDNYNGASLTEVGLFTEEGTLLARQVYPAILKDKVFQLQYTWTITFRS